MSSKALELLTKETAGLPNWAWGLVVVGGAGLGLWFVRRNSGTPSTSSSSTTANNALSQPADTASSTSGANGISGVGNGVDYGTTTSGSANPGSPVYVLSTSNPPTTNPPATTTNNTQQVTVRAKQASGPYAKYDAHANGVPIRTQPNGDASFIRTAAYGSQLTVTGPAIAGGGNTGNGTSGVAMWYPLQGGGYISSADIAGIGGGSMVKAKRGTALSGN